jgi:HTH-type transcriptional regulator/antitoxin HigA
MIKRGWLDVRDFKDIEKVESEVARFFGVESVEKIPSLIRPAASPHAAKKTETDSPATTTQIAWLLRVRAIAATVEVPRYSPAAVREALPRIEALLKKPQDVSRVGAILSEAGVRLVFVESLSTAKIDGVCTWLNDFAPVIGMTLRHDRIDNFYFVLRHEIEHVLKGHGRRQPPVIDVELGATRSSISDEEAIADLAAADFCVPAEQMDKFISKKSPYFMEKDVLGFAATVGRHPGLVVGQLQHKIGRFDRFRSHLVKVREFALAGAVADGWGNVGTVGIELARTP